MQNWRIARGCIGTSLPGPGPTPDLALGAVPRWARTVVKKTWHCIRCRQAFGTGLDGTSRMDTPSREPRGTFTASRGTSRDCPSRPLRGDRVETG